MKLYYARGACSLSPHIVLCEGGFDSKILEGKTYLFGEDFSVADAYLFTVTNWAKFFKFDLSPWPLVQQYQERVLARPEVQKAMKEEGLL